MALGLRAEPITERCVLRVGIIGVRGEERAAFAKLKLIHKTAWPLQAQFGGTAQRGAR